jgi:2-oxoglutarate dehydrogenase E1 component
MSLCFNPSHLEFVNPVALGRVRAKQDRAGDRDRPRAVGIQVHGDAAVAGEGIVQETLNLARLESYATGGTLHVVLDNGIGFTTPPSEYMSSERVTGVFRLLDIPIFHAGSDDPESVVGAVRHALRFRRSFACDVAIDLHCYRRFGHSEADDASFTQPLLSKAIRRRQPVRDRYRDRLLEDGVTTSAAARKMEAGHRESLARAFSQLEGRDSGSRPRVAPGGVWKGCRGGPEPQEEPDTSVSVERLQAWLLGQTRTPAGFRVHRKIQKGMESRRKMAGGELPLDWAAAESLAFASLAAEGVPVRLSGQDSARGTFGQRHAVLHDQETGACYVPLQHVSSEQAPVEIGNSPLSEAGVLGFEYGYSLDRPGALLLWEAQFGDFANAAQVIVDQFIASAEDKWNRLSGITLLLPHGFEGMGPEHSSARPERFLLLAAEDNIQILCPTTPAQYFHALRRQGWWRWKKPLVVLTPKGLLRSRHSRSTLDECGGGRFERIRADRAEADPERVRRVLLCTGRVAIDLERARQEREAWDVAVLRLEQLYPFRDDLLERALAPYTESESAFWVQEEPENMGAWRYLRTRYPDELPGGARLSLVSRPESASPATGSSRAHQHEQAELIARAFDAG